MSREALIAGHEIKKAFLREAIREGAYLERPRRTSSAGWSKQRKIGFRYAFQDIALEDLGTQYGGTRNNTSQTNHRFLDNIHKNSSPELQAKYPRNTIPDKKPVGKMSRERISASHGGISLRAKALLEKGISNPRQIQSRLNISSAATGSIRRVLETWGMELPLIRTSYKTIKETVEEEK